MTSETILIPEIKTAVDSETSNHLLPVFLKLEDLNVLVVGAGNVGFEKLTSIINNAPATRIKVVASSISDDVKCFTDNYPSVTLLQKEFTPGLKVPANTNMLTQMQQAFT